jgi:hypothetical protein
MIFMADTLHAGEGNTGGNCRGGAGASSLTRKQLRDYEIDSQVLFAVSFAQCCRASFANRYSFAIIRAIEFAAPKDFISLKVKPE